MIRQTARVSGALLLFAVTSIATPARAASAREQAEAEARKACAAGRVGEGIEMLAALLTEYGHPNYIYNQARCYQQNGKSEQAISRFKEYLRAAPDAPAAERAKVERFIDELGAEVQAAAPPPVTPAVEAAPITILEPEKAERPAGRSTRLPGVKRTRTPEPASRARHLRTAGIALGVIGVAGLGTGFVSSLQIRSLEQEVESARPGQLDSRKLADNEKKGQRYEILQWVGYGVGGAALAGALVCLILDDREGASADRGGRVRLTGAIGPDGSPSLALTGRF